MMMVAERCQQQGIQFAAVRCPKLRASKLQEVDKWRKLSWGNDLSLFLVSFETPQDVRRKNEGHSDFLGILHRFSQIPTGEGFCFPKLRLIGSYVRNQNEWFHLRHYQWWKPRFKYHRMFQKIEACLSKVCVAARPWKLVEKHFLSSFLALPDSGTPQVSFQTLRMYFNKK